MQSVQPSEIGDRWGRRPRSLAVASRAGGLALSLGLLLLLAASPAISDGARTIHGLATANLHLSRAEGSTLIETGPVSGVIVGRAQARLKTGSSYTGKFTMSTAAGTITGLGKATPSKAGRFQSFRGSFRAVSGTRLYAHVRGEAALYGVFDRRTDSVVVQTVGTLTY
jgi:hypothetical protein